MSIEGSGCARCGVRLCEVACPLLSDQALREPSFSLLDAYTAVRVTSNWALLSWFFLNTSSSSSSPRWHHVDLSCSNSELYKVLLIKQFLNDWVKKWRQLCPGCLHWEGILGLLRTTSVAFMPLPPPSHRKLTWLSLWILALRTASQSFSSAGCTPCQPRAPKSVFKALNIRPIMGPRSRCTACSCKIMWLPRDWSHKSSSIYVPTAFQAWHSPLLLWACISWHWAVRKQKPVIVFSHRISARLSSHQGMAGFLSLLGILQTVL